LHYILYSVKPTVYKLSSPDRPSAGPTQQYQKTGKLDEELCFDFNIV
jgi:hypothetical protein